LRKSSDDIALNTTVIGASQELESTLFAPAVVPAVHAKPVLDAVFNAVTDDSNGVTTEEVSSGMSVDTSLVEEEVLIDHDGSFNGTIFNEILHQILLTGNFIDRGGLDLILVISLGIRSVLTFLLALGSVEVILAAVFIGTSRVMVARRESIGLAPLSILVKTTGDDTECLPLEPSGVEESSVASHTADNATLKKIFSGNSALILLAGVNTDTVRHGSGSSESPAGTARALIANFANRLTVGPLLSGVKSFREIRNSQLASRLLVEFFRNRINDQVEVTIEVLFSDRKGRLGNSGPR